MRKPTSVAVQLRFWRLALTGVRQDVIEDAPQCGFWRMRYVKQGPWVPVKIWLDQPIDGETGELSGDETHKCRVGLEDADALRWWTYCAKNPITPHTYKKMIDEIKWAGSNDPTHPCLFPRDPIDPARRISLPC